MNRAYSIARGVASSLIAGLIGLTVAAPTAEAVDMKVAYATQAGFFHHAAAQTFKDAVEKATSGEIQVTLYPGGQLGGEVQILEGLKAGTIEAYIGTSGAMSNFVPELGIVDLPYLWRGYDHAFGILDGWLGDELRTAAEASGFHILGFWPAGRRDVYGNVAIETPDDMRGVKIRTLQTPVYVAAFEAFGAVPTPMAWPETYGALQQGVIDASETALSAMIAASQDEVVKYISLTGHGLTIANFTVASEWFNGLTESQQKAIVEAEKTARKQAIELERKGFDAAIDTLKQEGKTILEPDAAAFQKIVVEKVYSQFKDEFDPQTIARITGN